ncbi:hypothetical protein T439DRAFT_382999 [Meredithblackwellia eburnea MCA 4105]
MAANTNTTTTSEPSVFQLSLALEPSSLRDVLRAIISTILFQRVLGNTKPKTTEICGVTFPVPTGDLDLDRLVDNKVDEVARKLGEGDPGAGNGGGGRRGRFTISFYPTPLVPPPPPPLPSPSSQPLVPIGGGGGLTTTALNWFATGTSTVSKAFTSGGGGGGGGGASSEGTEEDKKRKRKKDKEKRVREFGNVWEVWFVEVELVREMRRGVGEEKLRTQLQTFLLRLLSFTCSPTVLSKVPPITTSESRPFGVEIIVGPVPSSSSSSSDGEGGDGGGELDWFGVSLPRVGGLVDVGEEGAFVGRGLWRGVGVGGGAGR